MNYFETSQLYFETGILKLGGCSLKLKGCIVKLMLRNCKDGHFFETAQMTSTHSVRK